MKVSPQILSLVPYKPGKPIAETQREYNVQTVIKLASNENPLGPSPKALNAMQLALSDQHRYPDASAYDLIQAISKHWSIPTNQIAVGNGSNELIDLMIRIFCEPNEAILTCDAAFVAYQVCAQAARVQVLRVPLKKDLNVDVEAFAKKLQEDPQKNQVRLVFLPNPNNPTGTYIPFAEIEALVEKFKGNKDLIFVFDEAYNEFVRAKDYKSAQTLLSKYENVAVIRTLSKAYGLAGVRVGVLLAQPFVIDLINRVRNPFNVNTLAQVAAIAALDDKEFVTKTVQLTHQGLDYFYEQLQKMQLPFIPSQGNFVMFDTLRDARQVNEALLKKGVILRPILNYGFKSHLRMSVGNSEENKIAIQTLEEILPSIPKL